MSIKKSVMISDHAESILLKTTRYDETPAWSQEVNRAIIAGDWIFRQSLPTLTPGEWEAVLNTYAGTTGAIDHPPYRVAADMMDDQGLVDVTQHPNADLVIRIHAMSQVEQYAILIFVERFWAGDWDEAADFSETIKLISDNQD